MKYIRTKDGIEELDDDWVLFCKDHASNKQADTIEELCDEFVFIDRFFAREHRLAYSLEYALACCKHHDVDVTTLRGAIWTDKGLIYVAKMNDKGVLELL